MSIQAVAWALDQDLPARPKLVLVSIANHANHVDGYCWLRLDTIAAEASCSRRAVFNFIGDLVRNGYVRKAQRRAEDGRQRANDYWILLNREPADWITVAKPEAAEIDEPEPGDDSVEACETSQDVDEQGAQNALGSEPVSQPEVSICAPGPSAPACTHIESAEPSKIKPEEGARANAPYRPRGYAPPPPPRDPPQGEVLGPKASDQIFVFFPSKAYDAWARKMSIDNRLGFDERGRPKWRLLITKTIDGDRRSGWYFPTLFPPAPADPPKETEKAS